MSTWHKPLQDVAVDPAVLQKILLAFDVFAAEAQNVWMERVVGKTNPVINL